MAMDRPQVLIVDDDPRVCRLIQNMACSEQFEYTDIVDPRRLKTVYEDLLPEKIFLDLSMPGMDGIEALTFLKDSGSTSHICLISGWSEKVLRSSCALGKKMGLNMSPPIHKPFRATEIRAFLKADQFTHTSVPVSPILPRSRKFKEELKHAIYNVGEIQPFYQPIVDLKTGEVDSLEALCRWHHPTRGILSPGDFLPLVEKYGLMKDLTYSLLKIILEDMACWDSMASRPNVSINLFPELLEEQSLPDVFMAHMKSAGIDPSRITIEITEQSNYGDSVQMMNVISRLRIAGFGLSLDDFGTGFASMEKVKEIPFTELKIDRSFVSDLLHDPDAKAIVKSSISLAQEIGIPTVAEGIENRETLSWLISNGCTRGQGYLLCPPGDFDKSILLAQSSTNHKYEIGEFDSGDVSSSTGTVSTKECQTTATLTVTPDIT